MHNLAILIVQQQDTLSEDKSDTMPVLCPRLPPKRYWSLGLGIIVDSRTVVVSELYGNRPLISMYTFSKLLVTYGQSSQQVGCINKTQPECEEAGRV